MIDYKEHHNIRQFVTLNGRPAGWPPPINNFAYAPVVDILLELQTDSGLEFC